MLKIINIVTETTSDQQFDIEWFITASPNLADKFFKLLSFCSLYSPTS